MSLTARSLGKHSCADLKLSQTDWAFFLYQREPRLAPIGKASTSKLALRRLGTQSGGRAFTSVPGTPVAACCGSRLCINRLSTHLQFSDTQNTRCQYRISQWKHTWKVNQIFLVELSSRWDSKHTSILFFKTVFPRLMKFQAGSVPVTDCHPQPSSATLPGYEDRHKPINPSVCVKGGIKGQINSQHNWPRQYTSVSTFKDKLLSFI